MCKFVGPRLDKSPGERWFDNLAKKLGKEHFHCFGICFCFSTGFSLLAVCCLLAFVSVVVCVCVWVFVFLFSLVFFFSSPNAKNLRQTKSATYVLLFCQL